MDKNKKHNSCKYADEIINTGMYINDLSTEGNSYLVIAHCTDGDIRISQDGCSLFDYRTACEIMKAHIGLGARIEIVKCTRVMYEVQQ